MNGKLSRVAAFLAASVLIAGCAAQGGTKHLSTPENLAKVQVGTSRSADVENLVGIPLFKTRDGALEYWEYKTHDAGERYTVWISLSGDGVVRGMIRLRDKRASGSV